ncbi:BTB/POZ domain-containing protein 6 isoform X1 [Tribolium castaneum]|uniref:BTB/POZ domain-containing protein 6-like Protein n=1 Tax=Tribolium castaneum TaxID=7070 RepID=D6WNZ2_TRICA|nr:PREDICTED: BTB/POZ domain-containing protein 6 isoform X1 [Tribolium castaneum]EFA04408.1 BTB/POZ domain-containing protein 6-like Protein [Tribolium castaneum]|eukprot:XP_974719.2 PREDICTED: BTB/POZ domain-containing protein 6 isoform X1 [Tribolium castaneum]
MSAPPPPPCDWQTTRKLVKERGQYLLETGMWSDCRFIVGTDPNQQVLEGHKLFLAMSSPVFEAMFFGGMAEKDPIAILDVQPDAFKALLEYIYTDKINLTSFDQACELCYGAKKYMLPHLVEECTKYLWSDLYPKNACRAYEFAKLFEEPILMEKCMLIICNQTQEVLSESSFDDVELSTILTVFDQDELNISSELELFSAISRYAARHNQSSGAKVPRLDGIGNPSSEGSNGNHPTIRDAIMKIRFLTLTPQQFAEVPASCNLLTESEKFAILMNICSPSATTPMPPGFSTSRIARRRKQSIRNECIFMGGASSMDTSRTSMIKFSLSANEGGNESPKKLYCCRQLLRITECMNTSVLDCAVTFTCDRNVCVYGIQVPTQIPVEDDRQQSYSYPELLYAHLLDADGSRLTYTHFTTRVAFRSLIEISFNRPVYIQRNKVYKVGVVLNKIGRYPIGTYPSQSTCNGVVFTFSQGQSGDSVRDGLVRSIIFSIPSSNHNSINNPGISGIPGDHNKMSNII